ncbi:MAG: sigma-54-dependent Fis family transcriptional regulator [Leptonema sp. (in: Bacteria)]|nr:sigma-54-dependent Fis family transcriptional regulator [Leptonema sp. (in: bacteria)]
MPQQDTDHSHQKDFRRSSRLGATFVYHQNGMMAKILEQVERYAPLNQPVLITGETGTGKEQIARLLHAHSGRSGNLVSVNLSAVPHDLIENELFGHIKGAFTGADTTTTGYVERAEEGTLFIDEIGDLPMTYQIKILRLVQDGQYEKLGSHRQLKSNARFIFATNLNLENEIEQSRFRSDLYYRLNTFHVDLPSLRQRNHDLPLLIEHFLFFAGQEMNRPKLSISQEATQQLLNYHWPGNVRELENMIYRLVAITDSQTIELEQLPKIFRQDLFQLKMKELEFHRQTANTLENELIQMALIRTNRNLNKTAELLGISRSTLQYRLNKAKKPQ